MSVKVTVTLHYALCRGISWKIGKGVLTTVGSFAEIGREHSGVTSAAIRLEVPAGEEASAISRDHVWVQIQDGGEVTFHTDGENACSNGRLNKGRSNLVSQSGTFEPGGEYEFWLPPHELGASQHYFFRVKVRRR